MMRMMDENNVFYSLLVVIILVGEIYFKVVIILA